MLMYITLSVLLVAHTVAIPVDPDPSVPPTKLPPTGRRPPEVPSLEDLQRGVGAGDPSDTYVQVVEMVNGQVSEKSREQWEQFVLFHTTEHDGFNEGRENEIYKGQTAYNRLIEALANGDETTAQNALKEAESFMNENSLTIEDAQTAAESRNGDGRSRRFLYKQNNALWDKCIIPYEYGDGFDGYDAVQSVMKTYEYYTGFRFVLWNESVPALYGLSHSNRLTYVYGGGCWSYVGNLRRSGQQISCCSGSTCVHEIGHAIGFLHEQESPLRDDYLRVEWQGIDPNYWSQYARTNKISSVTYGYYDATSVMHYWNGGFSINYKDTFRTLDPDRDFLVTNDPRYYYFFKEAMESHNCWDLFCSEELDCVNGGFPSVIDSQCACFCPEGLDPDTLCATTLANDASLVSMAWPAGSFTILNSVDGCPDEFELGWQYHEPVNYVWGSTPYHAKPPWQWYTVEHEFCSRIDATNDGEEWPEGSYCIYRKGGTCPNGFESGYIQMDDDETTQTNTTAGELPDGVYGDNTRWEFCCRSDGAAGNPIELPTRHPFILFSGSSCQKVKGMAEVTEYFTWRSDTADSYTEYGGSLPYMYKFSDHLFNLYFCYYTPTDKSDSAILELTDSSPEIIIKSPNYPAAYGSNKKVTYTILAPEGSKIQIDLNTFDVQCSSDTLHIAFSMPGHPGNHFCGSGFDKTIISSENYARLELTSGTDSSSSGFEAVVKINKDEDQCYRHGGKDGSYSGTVAFTKNLEPCLPWNEVLNCRFSRFSPETFDDDLSENYCRNTGVGTDPWCYTNSETCARDFCDACSIRKCYDFFDDCAALIAADSSYCSTDLDGQAVRGCRQSCGMCPSKASTSVTCAAPGEVDGAAPTPLKSSYNIGEQVEYTCGNDARTRTCTSSGEWTHLGYVCGACPNGWGRVDGLCYKWFDEYMSHSDAASFCNSKYQSSLAIIKTQAQNEFIQKIVEFDIEEMEYVWLSMNMDSGEWMWDDGSTIDYTNWKDGEPYSNSCGYMHYDGEWRTSYCSWSGTIVCTHTPEQRTTCADQISNCEDMIRSTPDLCVGHTDFADANCQYSCGICSTETVIVQGKRDKEIVDITPARRRRSDISIVRSINIENKGSLVRGQYRRLVDECSLFVSTTTEPKTTTTTTQEPTTSSTTTEEPTTTSTTTEEPTTTTTTEEPTTTTTTEEPTTTTTTEEPTTTTTTEEPTTTTTTEEPTTTTTTEEPTTTTTTEEPTTTTTTEEPTTTTTTEEPTTTTTTEEPTTTTTTEEPTTTTTTEEPTTTTTTEEPTTTTTTEEPTTTTTEAPVPGCGYPGTPTNGRLVVPSSQTSITTGQIYEFECNSNFALASGELIRACLVTDELTGSQPICAAASTVPEPVNDVNIRRRSYHGSTGYVYTAYNDDLKITKSGSVTSWRFYSSYSGNIALQVWRFSDGETMEATLIGQNIIQDTGNDRVRTLDIPTDEQISVQVGDVLAVNYPKSSAAGLPYTRCELQYESKQGNQRYGPNTNPEDLVIGNTYSFEEDSSRNCKTWSLNAYVR